MIPVVDPTAFVHPDAVLIGDVIVGAGAYVGPVASLRADFGRVVVGAGANVQDGCVLHTFPGRDCTVMPNGHVAHGVVLHGCTIEAFAMIGMNAVVMDDAIIGEHALVAAGAIVRANMVVPPRTLVAGNPAVVVRELDDAALEWKANGVRVYQDLAQRSRASLRPVTPLAEVEPNRSRVSTGADVSVPLREHRARDANESS